MQVLTADMPERSVRQALLSAVSATILTCGSAIVANASAATEPPASQTPHADRIPLPEGPEKRLIEKHCVACHDLARTESAGGSRSGWSNRLKRMIRRGSTLPPQDVAELASYLSRTLPERLKALPPDAERTPR